MPDDLPAETSAQAEPVEVAQPPSIDHAQDKEPAASPEAGSAETPAPEIAQNPPLETAQPEAEMTQIPVVESFPEKTGSFAEATPPPPPPAPPAAPVSAVLNQMLATARSIFQARKRKKLEKILALLDTKKSIASEDVQKLLRVSRQTAVRFLNQLEKEGKVVQVGAKGRGVLYVKAQ